MSLSQQLSQLRPLMTRAEIEAVLGREQANRALDILSNPQRDTGVYVSFSHMDEVIDYVSYLVNFPRDVAVCGVCIGMTVDAMRQALPEVRLADGEAGEPDHLGRVQYRAPLAALNAELRIGVKDGEVGGFSLYRADLEEVQARRQRQEQQRIAERDRKRERADRWKLIVDPDEMLMDWGRNDWNWGDDPASPRINFARWLIATSDPDIWHIVATTWNWDYDHAPLFWIVRQNDCDIATALEVFFLAEPSYYFRYGNDRSSVPAGYQQEHFDFLTEIRDRVMRGFYKRSKIAFDGERHMSYINPGLKTVEDQALARSFFPRQAGQKIPGRDLTNPQGDHVGECYAMLATVN